MYISHKKQEGFGVLSVVLFVGSLFFGFTPQIVSQVPGVNHVVIIGCDGLSPDGVQKAKTPNMDGLMRRGAYTFRARGVMPTSSSPNWASMLMGAGPEQHGVTSNDWRPNKFAVAPTAVGSGGIFPTIFGVLREQQPSSVIACFHDWGGFGVLFERKALDTVEDTEGPVNTTKHAVAYFKAKQPNFTFIHLDHIDHAGHKYGHGTAEYYKSVEEADRLIGETLHGLEAAGMLAQTILIVTSDHGGVGKSHGGATMAEIEIPWIIAGPGIVPAKELNSFVNIYDTAATVAHIFGLTAPNCWIAKPVLEAFESP